MTLQVINDDHEHNHHDHDDYDKDHHDDESGCSSDDPLSDSIMTFDFTALVQQFDQEQLQGNSPSSWSLMNGLLDTHLSSSDTAALGGDLAAQYANDDDWMMDTGSMRQTLSDPQFGNQAQTIGQSLNTSVTTIKFG